MYISRHPIDDEFMSGMATRMQLSLDSLPGLIASTKKRPQSLGLLATSAYTAAMFTYLALPQSKDFLQPLKLAKQALNGLYACAVASNGACVQIDSSEPIFCTEKPAPSSLYAESWLNCFFLNLIFGDLTALRHLCKVPTEILRASPTRSSEYRYLYKEALCAYVNHEKDLIERIISALKATDPARPDVFNGYMALKIGVPQLELLYYIAIRDIKFSATMQRAVQDHKDYWSDSQDNSRSPRGIISIDLLGLAVLGTDVGLHFDVESPYLPVDIIEPL